MATASEITRMSGLVSGLDIESLVKAGTMNTKNAIDTRKQKLQTLTWKQESYRSIITALSDFKTKYLNIESKNSVRANAVMKSNKAESSDSKLIANASASATAGNYSITSVKRATAAAITGANANAGNVELDFSKAKEGTNTVKITLDGTTKNVSFTGGENAKDNFLSAVNDAFSDVSAAKFSFRDGSNKLTIENAADDKVSHIFTIGYSDSVGLKNDASNRINTTSTLGNIDFAQSLQGSSFQFSINGKSFSFTSDTTVKDMMNTINKSDAGVTMSFNSLSQSFELKSNETGAGKQINITQEKGNLVNSLFNTDSIGTAPTASAKLTEKTVDDSAQLGFTFSKSGLASGDTISINGKTLGITGLTQKQKSEKITVDGTETNAKLYTDSNGDTIYKYTQDGNTIYAKKNGDSYDAVMTVSKEGTVNYNGTDHEDVTEADALRDLGIDKSMETHSVADIEKALNDAYKASFADGKGSFSVTVSDDSDDAVITFNAGEGEAASVSAGGNVSLTGAAANYTEAPYSADKAISGSSVSFVLNNSTTVTVNGTGENGAVTINDLVNTGHFSYDASTGELSVNGTDRLTFQDGATDIAAAFGTSDLYGSANSGELSVHGTNAQMTINGVTLESASNSFTVEGTTFNIADVEEFTEADIASGDAEAITVGVSRDTSKIKDTILEFVNEYNKLIDTVSKMLNTTRPKDGKSYYDPLTDDQKEEMEQDEIDKWEEKAKEGLLYHDSTLTRVFSEIRSAVGTVAVGGMTLKDLGIDTSKDYKDYGKLVIDDESVLDSAIEKYGDEIAKFFTDTKDGLGTRLNNAINGAIDTSTGKSGYAKGTLAALAGVKNTRSENKNTIYLQLTNMQTLIDRLNDRYEKEQERLWSRYSTLEGYIADMNNQSSSLFGTTQQ